MHQTDVREYKQLLCRQKLDRAIEVCERLGRRLAVTKVDGQATIITADYDPNRLRVEVEDGDVVDVVGMG